MFIVICIIGYIISGCFWGFITNMIISGKNYYEDWFLWGFFFHWPAVLVALAKPQNITTYQQYPGSSATAQKIRDNDLLNDNGWRCKKCGTVNPSYTGSCACGMTRQENEKSLQQEEKQELKQEASIDIFEEIKKYKELLDCNIITQDEFDKKKKELLKL